MNTLATKSFLIVVFIISCSTLSQSKSPSPCNRLVVYYHDILFNGTKNATSAAVTEISPLSTYNNFGQIVVFDDPVTKDNRLTSKPVARAQGLYFYNGKEDVNAWFAFTLVFNSTQHKGTLSIMGADVNFKKPRVFSVVGGTGDFLMSRGVCTITTDAVQGNFYFRLKMDIKLYACY